MKKTLLNRLMALAVVASATFCAAAEDFTVTFDANSKKTWPGNTGYSESKTSEASFGGTKWTAYGMANNNAAWDYYRVGTKSSKSGQNVTSTNYVKSDNKVETPISKVVVNVTDFKVGSLDKSILYVADNSDFTGATQVTGVNLNNDGNNEFGTSTTTYPGRNKGTITFDIASPAADMYYKVEFTCSNSTTTNGVFYMDKIDFYAGESAPVDPDAVPAPKYSLEKGQWCYWLTLTCDDPDAEIYYASAYEFADVEDFELTNETGYLYEDPIDVYEAIEYRAVAYKNGKASKVVSITPDIPAQIYELSDFLNYELEEGAEMKFETASCPVAVVYKAGSYTYIRGLYGFSNMLVYGSTDAKVGDVYSGISGTFTIYKGMPEIKDFTFGEILDGEVAPELIAAPTELPVEANMMHSYLKLQNVSISGYASNSGTITDADGNTVALRNQFYISDISNKEGVDISGFVGYYNGIQFWPVKIVPAGTKEDRTIYWAGENGKVDYMRVEDIEDFYQPWLMGNDAWMATYESSNEAIATVDEEGVIELLGTGEVTITATVAEDDDFNEATAVLTIKILTEAEKATKYVTVEFKNQTWAYSAEAKEATWTTEEEPNITFTTEVSISNDLDGDGTPTGSNFTSYPYRSGDDLRIYGSAGNIVKINAPFAYLISEATLIVDTANSGSNAPVLNGTTLSKDTAASIRPRATASYSNYSHTFANPVAVVNLHPSTESGQMRVKSIAFTLVSINGETGIESVEADANAPVEYFNLQGIRVANPESGLYIRRQGNAVSKVIR